MNDYKRRTVHKIVYSIKDYDRFAGFDAVVRLKRLATTLEEPRKPGKHEESIDESKQTESHEDSESKESKKRERERGRKMIPLSYPSGRKTHPLVKMRKRLSLLST